MRVRVGIGSALIPTHGNPVAGVDPQRFRFHKTGIGDSQTMALLGWLWLASPFVVIVLINRDQQLQRMVVSQYARCRAVGLAGAALMVVGSALVPTTFGKIMFVFGTPLTGLVVFRCRDDGGGGDEGEGDPDVPPVDWDEFERSFRAHVRGRPPRRPRAPSAR
jgi:hypothetical protein